MIPTPENQEKGRIARDSSINLAGAVLVALLNGVRAVLLPKLLPTVGAFGILQFLNLFKAYSPYFNFGVTMGYCIETPRRRGADAKHDTTTLTNTGFSFSLLSGAAVALLMVGMVCLWYSQLIAEVRYGLLIFAAVILANNVFIFYQARLRVEMNFLLKNQAEVLMALVFAVVAVAGVFWFQLYAVYAGLLLGTIAAVAWIMRRDTYRPRLRINWPELGNLMRIGVPVTVVTVLNALIFNVDLMVIKTFYRGFYEMGLYGLGVSFSAIMMMIPITAGHALATRIFQEAGKEAVTRDLYRYIRKPTVMMGALVIITCGAAFLLAAPVVKLYLPQYLPGLVAMKIVLWRSVFLAMVNTVSFVFDGLKRFYHMMGIQLLIVLLSLGLSLLFINGGYGINGVAAATLLTYIVYCFACLIWALRLCGQRWKTTVGYAVIVYVGCFYLMTVTAGIDDIVPLGSTVMAVLKSTTGKLLVYLIAVIPLLLGLERWLGMITELRSLLTGMVRGGRTNG